MLVKLFNFYLIFIMTNFSSSKDITLKIINKSTHFF